MTRGITSAFHCTANDVSPYAPNAGLMSGITVRQNYHIPKRRHTGKARDHELIIEPHSQGDCVRSRPYPPTAPAWCAPRLLRVPTVASASLRVEAHGVHIRSRSVSPLRIVAFNHEKTRIMMKSAHDMAAPDPKCIQRDRRVGSSRRFVPPWLVWTRRLRSAVGPVQNQRGVWSRGWMPRLVAYITDNCEPEEGVI